MTLTGWIAIKEDELRQKVIEALKSAGFDWLQDVELARHLRVPNWSIRRVIGTAQNGQEAFRVLNHPLVVDLQRRFGLLPASTAQ